MNPSEEFRRHALAWLEQDVPAHERMIVARGRQRLVIGAESQAADLARRLENPLRLAVGEGIKPDLLIGAARGKQRPVPGDGDGVSAEVGQTQVS